MPEQKKNKPKRKIRKLTQAKIDRILKVVSICGNISACCRDLGLDESTYYYALNNDPDLRRRHDEALNIGLDALTSEAYKRARSGSDRMMELILTRRRPEVWGEKKQEEHVSTQNPQININLAPQEPKDK